MTPHGPHSPPHSPPALLSASVGHYENFPVASWLCPPALRPAVVALYHFARTADDLADEGGFSAGERLAQLAAYRRALDHSLAGQTDAQAWPQVFGPLAQAARTHALPAPLLHDLISAFEQDVRHTAAGHVYADTPELLAYCRLSANPVGRLLLHLYGVHDERSLRQSDQICSALQLINFWQDISVDHARGRHYLPADGLARHGLQLGDFLPSAAQAPAATQTRCQALVRELCDDARRRMLDGAPLARRIPGRAGWELRLVVQGGLRILDKIEALQWQCWLQRPKLGKADMGVLLWRSLLGTGLGSRSSAS